MKVWGMKIYFPQPPMRFFQMKNLSKFYLSSVQLIGSLVFLTLGLVSCEQENYEDSTPKESEPQMVRLTAIMEDESAPSTRTALDQDGTSILWTVGDKIKVFTNHDRDGALFESINDSPSKQTDFEGLLDISSISSENKLYAVYPYSTEASFDGTSITTSLASEQVAYAEGFSDHLLPALAVSSDLNLYFYQVATGIRFLISTEGVKKVIFRGNKGEAVSGSFKVSMNDSGRPEITEVVDGCQWVTLVPPDNGTFEVGKMYYLSVLPHDFENGFTLTFLTDTKAARFEFNNQVTFKRAIWKNGKNLEAGIAYKDKMLSNGVPIVEVNVEGGAPVDSKKTWLNCSIRIGEDYYETIVSDGRIRGRGNATWWYPQKPYRIKFSTKESPFGFPANKDWVLLAEYNDHSLLRMPYMCEISKAADLPYTVNYKHINLYLNGEYKGVYILTDQVKVGKNRVNIDDDGFLIEEDLYYDEEPLWFTTDLGFNYSFKYPDADDGDIVENDNNYTFITNFFSELESALLNIESHPEIVESIIDYSSFAKWFLVQELLGNWEPNRFYVLESQSSKLKMYPAWDPEWSMGLADNNNPENQWGWYLPPAVPHLDAKIWETRQYFPWLIKDPVFREVLKSEWSTMKPKLFQVSETINQIESNLLRAQGDNFVKWPILDQLNGAALIALGSWEAEVEYVKNFFTMRIDWMDNYIQNL